MDARPRLDLSDPEFVTSTVPTPRLRDFDPRDYQRLVVNPFLAVFVLVLLPKLFRWLIESVSLAPVALLLTVPLLLLPRLIQFHCLDCGQTASYHRSKDHACHQVLNRYHQDRETKFPHAWLQLIIWGWILGSVAVLLLVLSIE